MVPVDVDPSRRILLVDDTPIFLELEKRLLDGRGYQLDTAASAAEALSKANLLRPQLILMDQQMPDMDGAECCHIIKNDPSLKDIVVILVTESQERVDVRKALESGCDDFVVKPITDMVLIQKVDAVFDPARRRRSPRMPVRVQVEFTDFESMYEGEARELGRGGMLLHAPVALDRDGRLQLSFSLPPPYDRRRVQVFGRVVYQRGGDGDVPDMGIEFIALDRESELLIEAMVRGSLESGSARQLDAAPALAREAIPAGIPPNLGRRMEEILDELYRLESDKKGLIREFRDLQSRYHDLELENIELARKVLESENENATLASLYVASYQLHMSLDFGSVLDTITQILVSLIGVDRFVLLFLGEDKTRLSPGLSYGVGDGFLPRISTTDEALQVCFRELRPYVRPHAGMAAGPADPLAVIPLAIRDDLLGVVAVYGTVAHKTGFTRLDEKLFQLLSHHAATAIYCSRAYSESERKRRTFQEFIRMLTH